MGVNKDQLDRSNALYKMSLDPGTLPKRGENADSLSQGHESNDDEPAQGDIMTSLARPTQISPEWEPPRDLPHSPQQRQTAILKEQIGNAGGMSTDNGLRDVDPLGTLLRSRTMPVELRSTHKEQGEKKDENSVAKPRL